MSDSNASTNQTRTTLSSHKLHSKLNKLICKRHWDRIPARIEKECHVRFRNAEDVEKYSSYTLPKEIEFVDIVWGNPLHLAIKLQAPSRIIRAIIDARPKSVRQRDPDKMLPLHLACMPKDHEKGTYLAIDKNAVKTFEMIYEAYRSALFRCSFSTPLHLVCEHKPPLSLINRILELSDGQHFECKKDEQSQIPLHVAIDYHASHQVIQKLIEIYPEGVKARRKGCLPIHCAAVNGCTHRVLVLLLTKYPEGMEKGDEDLDTPLHLVFSDGDYKKKWTCDGDGESRDGDVLDVKHMVYLMLKYYAIKMKQKRGVAKGNLAVKGILNKPNANKMRVIDLANICKHNCDVPRGLIKYLKKLASGRIVVDTENKVAVKQEEGKEEMTKEREINKNSAKQTKKRKVVHSPKKNKEEKRYRREDTEEGNEFEFDTEV